MQVLLLDCWGRKPVFSLSLSFTGLAILGAALLMVSLVVQCSVVQCDVVYNAKSY